MVYFNLQFGYYLQHVEPLKIAFILPQNFNRQGYLEVAKSLEIADKTAEGYISKFVKSGLIFRLKQDSYEKTLH